MSLSTELTQLSVNERIKCMEVLWESLRPGDPKSPEWHEQVLAERISKIERGEAEFVSGAELKARLAR
jgi:hypothetical protein